MPIKKNAEKALRQTHKRTARNTAVKDRIGFLVKKLRKSLEAKDAAKAKEWLAHTIKEIDKATTKKVLKKNTAARTKSRLTKRVNAMSK